MMPLVRSPLEIPPPLLPIPGQETREIEFVPTQVSRELTPAPPLLLLGDRGPADTDDDNDVIVPLPPGAQSNPRLIPVAPTLGLDLGSVEDFDWERIKSRLAEVSEETKDATILDLLRDVRRARAAQTGTEMLCREAERNCAVAHRKLDDMETRIGAVAQALLCGICQESVKTPKSLVCGHSFCGECLDGWTTSHHVHMFGRSCPECRHAFWYASDNKSLDRVAKAFNDWAEE
jgi:hypothetical protein